MLSPRYLLSLLTITIALVSFILTRTTLLSPFYNMSSPSTFATSLATRRSIYALSKTLPAGVDEAKIRSLVSTAVKHSPSSFNVQSARVVVLFGQESDKLWSIVLSSLEKIGHGGDSMKGKLDSFAKAGTILFFEDQDLIAGQQEQYKSYAVDFPIWSEHSSGILQGNVWTLLAEAGVGASLQHYSRLISDDVKKTWDLPASWELKSQMPFGGIAQPAGEKEFQQIEGKRLLSFGSL